MCTPVLTARMHTRRAHSSSCRAHKQYPHTSVDTRPHTVHTHSQLYTERMQFLKCAYTSQRVATQSAHTTCTHLLTQNAHVLTHCPHRAHINSHTRGIPILRAAALETSPSRALVRSHLGQCGRLPPSTEMQGWQAPGPPSPPPGVRPPRAGLQEASWVDLQGRSGARSRLSTMPPLLGWLHWKATQWFLSSWGANNVRLENLCEGQFLGPSAKRVASGGGEGCAVGGWGRCLSLGHPFTLARSI